MKIIIILLTVISFSYAAPTPDKDNKSQINTVSLASIVKIEGRVKVLSKNSIKKRKPTVGEFLQKGDKLITYRQSKVYIALIDNSKIILDENSELTLINSKRLKQEAGEIYYKIKKRHGAKGLKIETPFSIIGIKGTEFIVNSTGDGQIALNKGLLGIEALRASYELHKERVLNEFEEYKRKQDIAFERYVNQAQDDIVSYVKELSLESSKVLHFKHSNNCKNDCESYVSEKKITDNIQKRFKKYQQILDGS